MSSSAGAVFAQSSDDFLHGSGGDLGFTFKSPSHFNGSFALSTGGSAFGTFGGTLVKDRAWFFASGVRTQTQTATQTPIATPRFDTGSLSAVVGDHTSFAASSLRAPDLSRTFLSLHSTTVISPNAFFTATVSSNKN